MPTGFVGIFAATVTPMSSAEDVDYDAIGPLADRLIAAGVAGLVPCGGTGEFSALSSEERREVTRAFIEAAGGRVPVIPHTGALSTRETIDLTVRAEALGAAAAMVVPPFYDPLSWRELYAHYEAVAKAVRIPIVLYNMPGSTKVDLRPEQAAELAGIDGIRYIKDSSGNLSTVARLLDRFGDRISLMNGADSLAFHAFALGAKSAVWGAANLAPRACVELHRAVVIDDDIARGRDLWRRLWPVTDALETPGIGYAAAVKYGCEVVGHPAGPPRRPILPLDDAFRARLDAVLAPFIGA